MARTTPGLQLHPNKLLFTVSSSLHRHGNAYRLPSASLFFTSNLSPRSYHFNVNHVSLPSLSSSSVPRVSTVPVEHAAPAPDFDFHREISRLNALYSLSEMIESWDGVNGIEGGADKKKKKKREERPSTLKELLKTLADVERFYDCIGGIIGYQMMV